MYRTSLVFSPLFTSAHIVASPLFHSRMDYQSTTSNEFATPTMDGLIVGSPTGVSDFEFEFPEPAKVTPGENIDMFNGSLVVYPDDDLLAEESLEWLIDGGINHLPETTSSDNTAVSSPPFFPDFKSSDYTPGDIRLIPAASSSGTELALSTMADPSVTVASLLQ
jgi:hypothetical protein